jgi:hypothetical protein
MKNSKLIFFFAVGLIMIFSFPLLAQDASAVPTPGLFAKISAWVQSQAVWSVILFICGIASKNGWTKIVKAIAGKTTIITRELSHVSLAVSNFSELVDKSIKEDGSVDQNSLKDAVTAGKTVIVESKEAWITIKPKPVLIELSV